jgi:Rrf2 family transcriptional regulator, iron-sulfur cluster assembly transcription factor
VRLSTRAHYAVRAILDLALHSTHGPVAIQEIARRQAISPSYLEQLFVKLRRGQIIRSVRGARGGYQLARPADQVHLADIIELVDEPLQPVACLDGRKDCARASDCLTRNVWRRLGNHIRTFLTSITVDQLVREIHQRGTTSQGEGQVPSGEQEEHSNALQ